MRYERVVAAVRVIGRLSARIDSGRVRSRAIRASKYPRRAGGRTAEGMIDFSMKEQQ
jgi:hypothetical protein